MRLDSIKVLNFFGIDHADVKLSNDAEVSQGGNLTLLVGANGSGKSSLIKAAQFLAEHYPYQARGMQHSDARARVVRSSCDLSDEHDARPHTCRLIGTSWHACGFCARVAAGTRHELADLVGEN